MAGSSSGIIARTPSASHKFGVTSTFSGILSICRIARQCLNQRRIGNLLTDLRGDGSSRGLDNGLGEIGSR